MYIRLITLGTKMPAWVNDGVKAYQKRLAGDIRLDIVELPLPKRGSASIDVLIKKEAELITKQLQRWPQALRVALEVKGKRHDTHSLSRSVSAAREIGQDMVILVGGPDGLCPSLSASCHEQWSLSDLTLPHPLVRLIIAEQVYRVWSLLQGHPYHR
ncbi:MAG TPA: 23S rRNA (pseudouridine(1915)-N(3))-methyltransferase RlmH [Alcanivoracaceae bacterium]|nr:23S rRNA (pseudouridine(1915)-N(3))-methyltransferase RlmH [Alcanivoracaceae bacterium]